MGPKNKVRVEWKWENKKMSKGEKRWGEKTKKKREKKRVSEKEGK